MSDGSSEARSSEGTYGAVFEAGYLRPLGDGGLVLDRFELAYRAIAETP